MTQEMLIMAAILVAVILLTFIGILSRYRKCKSDEVLVVYGRREEKRNLLNYTTVVPHSSGRLSKATNFCQ